MNVACLLHDIFSLIVNRICLVPVCLSFNRSNNVELSKRIIVLAKDFVHALIRIGPLDFRKGAQ